MYVLMVQVEIREDMLEAFEPAILENAARSVEREPGCLRFDVSQQIEDPRHWLFHEVYTEEAAHAAHRQTAHFKAYSEVANRAVVSKSITRCTAKRVGA